MKLQLNFTNSIYDCKAIIRDAYGRREMTFPLVSGGEDAPKTAEIEVSEGEFELTLRPVPVDYKHSLDEMERMTWKGKLLHKVLEKGLSFLKEILLRVGCTYRISGVSDGDQLTVNFQMYAKDHDGLADLFELIPVMYMYYELEQSGKPLSPCEAWAINPDDLVKSARKIALLQFGIGLIFTYPLRVGRVKRLVRDRKIRRILQKFYALPDKKRQAILAKMEK